MTRIERAAEVKAIIDKTEPITDWGHTSRIWFPDGVAKVRIYINKGNATTAWVDILDEGVVLHETTGNAMTRNAIAKALDIPMSKVQR